MNLRFRPVSAVHRGVVETRRAWMPDPLYEGVRARERLLALWQPGTIFRSGPKGMLVEWPQPRRIDTRIAPVLALLEQDERSTSAPLHPLDVAQAPPHSVVLLQGGQVLHLQPSALPVEDPSTWLDFGPLEISKVEPLGFPPPPAVVIIQSSSSSRVLGITLAPGALSSLPAPVSQPTLQSATGRALGQAAAQLGRMLQKAPLPQWVADQGTWLERWGDKLGLSGALSALFGLQHAQYLRDLFLKFDDGDWMGGIERAIPLKGTARGPKLPYHGPALDFLRSRGSLDFQGAGPERRPVELAGDLFDRLKQLYRKAFEALDQQGRHREAAYVLAELLGETEEALAYLEKLGEFKLAAELAEVKGLDPARMIFLWLRAGDGERALALARLYSAWAAAIEHFERRNLPQPAERLRLEWAEHLARSGRYAAAVDVAWAVPSAREQAGRWLLEAVAAGGSAGARSLGRALDLLPEPAGPWNEAVRALLEDDTADGLLARAQLARSLPSNAAGRRVARALGRQLLRDAPLLDDGEALVRQCATLAADGGLLTDLPAVPKPPPRPAPHRFWTAARGDTGTVAVLDAVALPRDRVLVALGELGARLLGPDGEVLATFAHPTHRMVPSPDGRRVLLLGQRGQAFTIARLDPVTRALDRWCEATLDAFCDEFDGSLWFVAQQGRVLALDVHAGGLSSGWSLDLTERHGPDVVPLLSWSPEALQIAVAAPPVLWYAAALPSLAVRLQAPLPEGAVPVGVGDKGLLFRADKLGWLTEDKQTRELKPPPAAPQVVVVTSSLVATAQSSTLHASMQAALWDRDGQFFSALELEGARRASVRAQRSPSLLVVTDDLGRVRVIDLVTWRTRADLRV